MGVVVDVVLAVAVVAVALGAVAELQLRIGNIGAAADGAAVMVGSLGLGFLPGVEGDGTGFGLGLMEAAGPPGLYPPGQGDKIGNILAEEQEVVGKGNQREQIVGEAEYRVRQVPHIKKN